MKGRITVLLVIGLAAISLACWYRSDFFAPHRAPRMADTRPSKVCHMRLVMLSQLILDYAGRHNGEYPAHGWDSKNKRPMWMTELIKEYKMDMYSFKCPCDSTGDLCSYEYVLQAKTKKEMDAHPGGPVVILREKSFAGSHGFEYSLP